MVKVKIIKAELDVDPLTRGYSGMTDAQVVTSMNAEDRTRNRATMEATEVLNAINETEFDALSAADQQRVWDILHIGTLNPFGLEATLMISVFGGGSATITALGTLRVTSISRATELLIPTVKLGHVAEARSL